VRRRATLSSAGRADPFVIQRMTVVALFCLKNERPRVQAVRLAGILMEWSAVQASITGLRVCVPLKLRLAEGNCQAQNCEDKQLAALQLVSPSPATTKREQDNDSDNGTNQQ